MIDQRKIPAADAEQRRHTARHKMFGPVTLCIGDARMRGHFLDLSSSGALAHCETPPAAGTYLQVKAPGIDATGRVMWAKGKRFGIQFSQPMSEDEMNALIRSA